MAESVIILLISFAIILAGCELFTNGVEWFGFRLELSEGAVGSVLAAVGTALPETIVPIIAIVAEGGKVGHDVGIGAILGAPFMLSTLAMFVTGSAVLIFSRTNGRSTNVAVDKRVLNRDIAFFLVAYAVAISVSFLGRSIFSAIAIAVLIAMYFLFVLLNLRDVTEIGRDGLGPLHFARRHPDPRLWRILAQMVVGLGLIISGARLLVGEINELSLFLGVPVLILSLIIAPIATELPEKFNSVIWVRQGKDTLALGNITGAMVFQSAFPTAVGIALTDWVIDTNGLVSALLALFSGVLIFLFVRWRREMNAYVLLLGGLFYSAYLFWVLSQ